uniref:Uncharacterized protein n=1 Tax=Setaria italica TaxID=4555 RepID=K3YFD6_SETIT
MAGAAEAGRRRLGARLAVENFRHGAQNHPPRLRLPPTPAPPGTHNGKLTSSEHPNCVFPSRFCPPDHQHSVVPFADLRSLHRWRHRILQRGWVPSTTSMALSHYQSTIFRRS